MAIFTFFQNEGPRAPSPIREKMHLGILEVMSKWPYYSLYGLHFRSLVFADELGEPVYGPVVELARCHPLAVVYHVDGGLINVLWIEPKSVPVNFQSRVINMIFYALFLFQILT